MHHKQLVILSDSEGSSSTGMTYNRCFTAFSMTNNIKELVILSDSEGSSSPCPSSNKKLSPDKHTTAFFALDSNHSETVKTLFGF